MLSLLILSSALSSQLPVPRIRDSAGVRIVENSARLTAPIRFKLADKPSYDVGGLHGDNLDAELTSDGNIRGALRLRDGSLVVGEPYTIKRFDKDGKYVGSFGRQGGGPGEFGGVYAICLTRGDTIVVADFGNYRIQIMNSKLALVRNIPFAAKRGFYPQRSGCLGNGSFLINSVDPAQLATRNTKFYLTYDLNGKQLGPGLTLPDAPFDMLTSREVEITGVGAHFYYGNQLSNETRVYSPAGKLEMLVRSADPMVPIKPSEINAGSIGVSSMGGGVSNDDIIQRRNAKPHDENWPAYNRVLADADGNIWVEDYVKSLDRRSTPNVWTAFDATGKLIGRLALPASPAGRTSRVESFGKNDVMIRRKDADGALHYTIYPLVRVP